MMAISFSIILILKISHYEKALQRRTNYQDHQAGAKVGDICHRLGNPLVLSTTGAANMQG